MGTFAVKSIRTLPLTTEPSLLRTCAWMVTLAPAAAVPVERAVAVSSAATLAINASKSDWAANGVGVRMHTLALAGPATIDAAATPPTTFKKSLRFIQGLYHYSGLTHAPHCRIFMYITQATPSLGMATSKFNYKLKKIPVGGFL